jgi:predicted unusual protein kinase regulating ubiquinone biosynthesis (AarF/ABC1/UbiB family)
VEKELDFRIEENNGIRTKELYKDFPQLYIPSYYS